VLGWLFRLLGPWKQRFERARLDHRWQSLRQRGMQIGNSVWLPASTFIDDSHCFLISIGDNCGFGEQCMILAHDAQMDEFLDAARLGRVTIHESCHIGARSIILAGVEIGPRTIVGANSVVAKTLPPDTVCAGNPAEVICSLDEYLQRHRSRLATRPTFSYEQYDIGVVTPEGRVQMIDSLRDGPGYMIGGHSAELAGRGGTPRTGPSRPH
jgi:maltose O-acetyltransferase